MNRLHLQSAASSRIYITLVVMIALSALIPSVYVGVDGPYYLDSAKLTPITDHVTGDEADVLETNPMSSRLFGRIVSIGSFVLEAQLSGGELEQIVSKSVNIGIHLTCAAGLLLLLFQLLSITDYRRHALPIAATVVAIWILSPPNIGTAFYAVQRIAQLSSLFMILGLVAYTTLRIHAERPLARTLLVIAYGLCLFLAIASKENGVNLIAYTLAVELFFFGFRNRYIPPRALFAGIVALLIVGALGVLALKPEYLDYGDRSFTMIERLLSQLRIIPMYIQDLMLPSEHATGLFKQIKPSEGLFTPLTTFFGLIAFILYIATILVLYRLGFRYIAFGLAFFAVGHGVESTIIPLELHFLHRNYVPSVGLYLALVLAGYHVSVRLKRHHVVATVACAYLIFMGTATYARATAWSSEFEMGAAAYRYNPEGYRSASNYTRLLVKVGKIPDAIRILEHEAESRPDNDLVFRLQRLYYACIFEFDQPDTLYENIATAGSAIPDIELSSVLQMLVRGVYQQRGCPAVDVHRLVEALGRFAERRHELEIRPWYVHFYRVRLLRADGHDADANALLQHLSENGHRRNAGLMLADHYLRQGEPELAEEAISGLEEELSLERIERFGIAEDRMDRKHGLILQGR